MSANIKCYDPATGGVLFDLASNITRIVQVITVKSKTRGSITVTEQGQPFAYWVLQSGGVTLGFGGTDLFVDINDRTISYRNLLNADHKLYIGVIAI